MQKSKIAIYPGSFDPITLGHIDIIKRALKLFDHIVIAIAINIKKNVVFSNADRIEFIYQSIDYELENNINSVSVTTVDTLLGDFADAKHVTFIIRGIRSNHDLYQETDLAGFNRILYPNLETVFLPTSEDLRFVNSSVVRELLYFNKNIDDFVSKGAVVNIQNKYKK